MDPQVPGELRVEREAPHRPRPDAHYLVVPPGDRLRIGSDRKDPGRADEHPGKQRTLQVGDAYRRLERLPLRAVVVPTDPHVQDAERLEGRSPRARGEIARQQDEPGAGSQDRKSPRKADSERLPESGVGEEPGDGRRLSSGQEQRL